MAENVQRHIESTIPELEAMLRTKLYSKADIDAIQKCRKRFEYRLLKAGRSLEDYIDYILFEEKLLRGLRARRSKHRELAKKSDIEYNIMKRIIALYRTAISRFPDSERLCLSFFKFGKDKSMTAVAQEAVTKLIRHHAGNPKVWQLSANFYAYDKKDIPLALLTLDKGRALHKNCGMLYIESIKLEIFKTKEIKLDDEAVDEANEKMCSKRIILYLEEMFENVKDEQSYSTLLKVVGQHKFLKEVKDKIRAHKEINCLE